MSMLTAEIRNLIDQGMKDTALAAALSNDRVSVTRHQARKYIEMYNAEKLAKAEAPKPKSNGFEAETREEWFMRAQASIERKFEEAGYPVPPKVRIGCGFPSGGKRSKSLGECWKSTQSGDETFEIFINPRMGTGKTEGWGHTSSNDKFVPERAEGDLLVLETVWHELIHAALWHGGEENHSHGPKFKALAQEVGLEMIARNGMTQLTEAGFKHAQEVLTNIGPYPMGSLDVGISVKETQPTRMVKLTSPDDDEYIVRMSRETITVHGVPRSPKGAPMVIDPMSALQSEYSKEKAVALGFAEWVVGTKKLTFTPEGRERADEIVREILNLPDDEDEEREAA